MNWDVERLDRNVHRINFYNVASGFDGRVLLTADRHHDSPHAIRELERRHLDAAKENDWPIVDLGDLFDAMQGRNDRRSSKSDIDPEVLAESYFDELVRMADEFYAPYAKQFAVLGLGNHETAILKHNETNLTHRLASRLRRHSGKGWPHTGGYGGWVLLKFHIHKTVRHTIRLKYFHGSGGGGPVTKGVIQTNRRAVFLPDAEIIATGHIHEGWVMPIKQERISQRGVVRQAIQYHVSVPTYKAEYGDGSQGWHVERGAPPKPIGCAWLKFSLDSGAGRIRVKPELDIE